MRAAGVREFKAKLSKFLQLVRDGEVVLITDHGEVVAQVAPPPSFPGTRLTSEIEALARLSQSGELRPAQGRILSAEAELLPAPKGLNVRALLDDVRGE